MSQTLRSVGVIAVFSAALFLTRSMPIAAMAMGIAAIASLVLVTAPLALLETEKSRRVSLREVGHLFVQCAPLFGALFLFNLIESMPKFVMEGALAYKYQLYFNALFFPAQAILLSIGFIYKPQLLRLSSIWANPRKRRRFGRIRLTHVNLNDGTAEGIQLLDAPCFSVQYHPEASPGPTDAHYLFTAFTRLMDGEENYLDIDTAKDRLAGWNFAETAATETEEN